MKTIDKMGRSVGLFVVLMGLLCNAFSSESAFIAPEEIVQIVERAYADFDFELVGSKTHPDTLKMFRETVDEMIANKSRSLGSEFVAMTMGLSNGLSELDEYDDLAYYVHIMDSVTLSMSDRDYPDIVLLASEEIKGRYIVTYRKKEKLATISEEERFYSVRSMEFRKDEGFWRKCGAPLPVVELYLEDTCLALMDLVSNSHAEFN